MEAEPDRWYPVDASRSIMEIQRDIRAKVLSLLEDRS